MQKEHLESPQSSPEAGALEFKPAVRYTGYGLLMALVAGLSYALFCIGYRQGASEAVASGEVAEGLNASAVRSLVHLLQIPSVDAATLHEMAAHPETCLGWIRDESVRREAEWMIANSLLAQGSSAPETVSLLADLFARAPQNRIWARRAEQVALAHAAAGRWVAAQSYYRYAASRYGQAACVQDQSRVLGELAAILAYAPDEDGSAVMNLESLLEDVSSVGETESRPLICSVMACLSKVCRDHGKVEEANRYAQSVLQAVQPQTAAASPIAAVCVASMLIDQGEKERPAVLLKAAIPALEQMSAAPPCLPVALSKLAFIHQEENDLEDAFSLLGRAEGLAARSVPPDSSFWPQLHDQRGWLYVSVGKWEAALDDFQQALEARQPRLRLQPLEGAGRCLLALGQPAKALAHLQECVRLRQALCLDDAAALGRVYVLEAGAYDQSGQTALAAKSYRSAVEALTGLAESEAQESRILAMRGLGYTLAQLERWQEAVQTWEALLPLLREQRRETAEALRQIRLCRGNMASIPRREDASSSSVGENPV